MEPIIQVNNLTKKYHRTNHPAVNNISFNVKQGEFFAFLGPNGAGKTTTISVLTTTLSKTNGSVRIAGYNLETETKKVRSNIGIIFQSPSLDLDLSAEENIRLHVSLYGLYGYRPLYRFMPKPYKNRIEELAKMVGIEEDLHKKLKTFSGGMRRKLEIVRSLMHQPKVLFLDEPTTGLDAASRKSLWKYLEQVRKEEGITIFLTTHYLEETEGADRVCIINEGEISLIGTPEEIKGQLLGERYLKIDAMNRLELKEELQALEIDFTENDHYLSVRYEGKTPQTLISSLKTSLIKLEVHEPTIEDAYVSLLEEKESGEAI